MYFAVYTVNCGIFFLILVFLGIILPRRFKFRMKFRRMTRLPQVTFTAPGPVSVDAVSGVSADVSNDAIDGERNTPAVRLFYWYRIVIRLVQKISGTHLKPNQTLREYINNTGRATGAAATVFLEFTRIVEKVLYSPIGLPKKMLKTANNWHAKCGRTSGNEHPAGFYRYYSNYFCCFFDMRFVLPVGAVVYAI